MGLASIFLPLIFIHLYLLGCQSNPDSLSSNQLVEKPNLTTESVTKSLATCIIKNSSAVEYSGDCVVTTSPEGHFQIRGKSGGFIADRELINFGIVEPGVAEVRGLTTLGNNSRWGKYHQIKRNSACWEAFSEMRGAYTGESICIFPR